MAAKQNQPPIDSDQTFTCHFSWTCKPDLICLNLPAANPFMLNWRLRETTMPIESALVTVFVVAVFTGFALVLAWAEHRTRSL
jgi:hypothetical protein